MLMHGTITGTSDVDNQEYSQFQQNVEIFYIVLIILS